MATRNNESPVLFLTEEEAYTLLMMCMVSPAKVDPVTEIALRKLANFCKTSHYYIPDIEQEKVS